MFNLQRLVQRTFRPTIFRMQFSSSTVPQAIGVPPKSDPIVLDEPEAKKVSSPIVAAAFESLFKDELPDEKSEAASESDETNTRIVNAKSVVGLLAVVDSNSNITRKHALKIVSILAEWSSIKRAKLSEFENDPRFIKLCRLLGRTITKNQNSFENTSHTELGSFRTEDLNTVMKIAGDDEAAKLVASISIPQMIKVMSELARKRRRSTPLLRSLAYNISSNSERLDLKQCADLLYAMTVLNFPDSVLIARVGIDIQNGLAQKFLKSSAVGSIITSFGLLKFRDTDVLECLAEWILQNQETCRTQDISSLFLTLAAVNYPTTKSEELETKLVNVLNASDFIKSADWLSHVWALVVLNFASAEHFASVLGKEFIEKLVVEQEADLSPITKMKLLNINAAAKYFVPNYSGPVLADDSELFAINLKHSQSKKTLVNGLTDALKGLFSSSDLIRTDHDTRMGFVIDAECVLDQKGNPLPVKKIHTNATRVAIMVRDFHDMCQGAYQQPSGHTYLSQKLLEHAGYKIVDVPYNEFSTSEKLLKRVQYIEGKLKRITNSK